MTQLLSRFSLVAALASVLTGAVLLPGCATSGAGTSFPVPDASWQTYTGQMHYAGPRSIVGEVVVRRHGSSDFQMAFSSGPGFPLLQLRESGDQALAEGVLARGTWRGSASKAPARLAGFVHLREVFAAIPARGGSFSGPGWQAVATVSNGHLQHLVVTSGSERFTFHFSR